jgi:hypothetical protein|tara:strand:- start:22652 stop:22855 length:204 start_codon:yes stop_codon:yes gene_type:complete
MEFRVSQPLAASPSGRGYGRRAMRKAKRKAQRGARIGQKLANICSRSLKSGKGCRNKKGSVKGFKGR